MDGFGMVLIVLRAQLQQPVAPEVPPDKPEDFKRFDLEALKQPEEACACCRHPSLRSSRPGQAPRAAWQTSS
jgi:hypothetical protein